jgi:hypothetical protein
VVPLFRIAAPEDLPEGYLRFLDKQGMINASMKKRLMGGELFCHVTHPGRTHLCVHPSNPAQRTFGLLACK